MFAIVALLFVFSQASYNNDLRTKEIEMRASRYYSPSNSYITLTTSTDHPKVSPFFFCTGWVNWQIVA